MEKAIIYLVIIVNIAILYQFVKSLPATNRFLCIIMVPVIFYFLNYPLRAFILISKSDNEFSYGQILSALSYATLFVIILLLIYIRNKGAGIDNYNPQKIPVEAEDIFICHATFIISLGIFIYSYYNGKLFGLYTDEADLYSTFSSNLIMMFDSVKWFCIASCAIVYSKIRRRVFLVELITIVATIFFQSVASTAKGPLVALMLFYLFVTSLNHAKINHLLIVMTSIIIYLYMKATYLIRYFGVVRGEFSLEQITSNYADLRSFYDASENIEQLSGSVADRFNYLDGLILTMQNFRLLDNGYYSLGGIAELLNILPRFVWEDRPLINFNIYLTQNIWGFEGLVSETPIGRIGESFFVLGYGGLLYAILYGKLLSFVENKIFNNSSISYLSMYFVILYYYVWSDAHIMFYWKTILWVILTITILGFIYKHLSITNAPILNTDDN